MIDENAPKKSHLTEARIEVFHTRDQNHVTAGCDSILGVKLCNSRSGSGTDMLSKLAANLVKASLGLMWSYKNVEAAGVSYPCNLSSNFILHTHGLTRIHSPG